MGKVLRQIPIDWNAPLAPAKVIANNGGYEDDPRLVEAFNDIAAIHQLLEGDDFATERILRDVLDVQNRWSAYLRAAIREIDTEEKRA